MKIDLNGKRDLGAILDDSFALYRQNWRTLLLVAIVVVVPVHLLVYGVGLGWLWEAYPADSEAADLGDVGEQLAGIAAQLLVVTPLVTAMAVHAVRAAGEGRRAGAGETLRAGFDVFGRLFPAVVLVALGVALGLIALIVPGIYLAVRWVAVPQAVVVEGKDGADALRRSWELTQGKGWFAFFVLLVANLLVGVLAALVLLPLEFAARDADTLALSLLGQIIGTVLSVPLLAVAYTLLYYTLFAEHGQPSSAVSFPPPPPGPPPPPQSVEGGAGGDRVFGDGFAPPSPPPPAPAPPS